ncbi:RidA family protein [Vitreimonas flagellata]|uniref:RidA family protein n=1 Tax=Vitreimonas flagellata TaxID=2560861 RepID=UPI00107501E4|nr:RidA family protein [Vitreimonas flagellata]
MTRRTFHFRREGEQAFGYAQAVQSGQTLHVSGTLAVTDAFQTIGAGNMRAQLIAVYDALRQTLEAFDATFAHVVKETIFVTDMDAFIEANDIRLAIYAGLDLPAVTAVEVRRLAFPGNMIEIELIAAL